MISCTSIATSNRNTGQMSNSAEMMLDQNKHKITFDWNRFGLDAKTTPAGQLTDYVHDKYGLLAKIDSKWHGKTDRSIKFSYDKFDRIVRVDYGSGNIETRKYDSWGKLIEADKNGRKSTFQYDYFGRLIRKTDGGVETKYAYNKYGQRIGRQLKNGSLVLTELKTYDQYGRLTEIESNGKKVKYLYNGKNQLVSQIVDKIPIDFSYTKYGQLETKTLGGKLAPVSTLKYFYSPDGMITGRVVNGKYQMYSYDKRGQLLRVAGLQGKVAEQYVYDPAGNILSKTIDGKTTTFMYDKANQLVSSTCDGKVTKYQYDAAGRLIQEGDKSYSYGWLDKVLAVRENGKKIASFDYQVDGQIAQAIHGGKAENFLWDDIALVHRGETSFINEPYVTGGNPILNSKDGVMFNDMLGSTQNIGGKAIDMTAFGETKDADALFTGKPFIGELGYAFLFRNYRADKGKWLSTDPLGYPDGWNNFAYVNNAVMTFIDFLGAESVKLVLISDNSVSGDAESFRNAGYVTIENVTSNSDAVLKIARYVTDTRNSISDLAVSGHGLGGGVSTSNGSISLWDIQLQSQIDVIKNALEPNATYTSFGCNSGIYESDLQKIANKFGVTARGFTGPVNAGPNPDYGEPGILDILLSYITGKTPIPPGYHWVHKASQE